MTISPVSSLNYNIKNLSFGTNQDKTNKEKKSKISTQTGIVVGSGLVILGTIIAGVLLHRSNVIKKAENGAAIIEKNTLINLLKGKASEEELAAKLAEIGKLPPKEQIKAYRKLNSVCFGDIEALKWAQEGDCSDLKRGMREIPSDVKEEMDKGHWIRAVELYENHVQKLPETFKAKCRLNTVEETISNLPWAKSKVKPHTYDLTKEGEEIQSCTYSGKYHPITTSKEGILYHDVKHKTSISSDQADVFPKGTSTISEINSNVSITHGLSKDGKYVTILNSDDGTGKTALALISKNNKPTPAQEDLLSLVEHPEKFDKDLIWHLCYKNGAKPETAPNFDYDLALSIIQSMAKGSAL